MLSTNIINYEILWTFPYKFRRELKFIQKHTHTRTNTHLSYLQDIGNLIIKLFILFAPNKITIISDFKVQKSVKFTTWICFKNKIIFTMFVTWIILVLPKEWQILKTRHVICKKSILFVMIQSSENNTTDLIIEGYNKFMINLIFPWNILIKLLIHY